MTKERKLELRKFCNKPARLVAASELEEALNALDAAEAAEEYWQTHIRVELGRASWYTVTTEEWNTMRDEELEHIKTIEAKLDATNSLMNKMRAAIINFSDGYGTWKACQKFGAVRRQHFLSLVSIEEMDALVRTLSIPLPKGST